MFSAEEKAADLLDSFKQRAQEFPSDIPFCVELGPKDAPFTVVIGSAIHGNETGSVPAAIAMIDDLSEDVSQLNARYFFILGNPEALRAGTRFVQRDLNRCFLLEDDKSLEGKRSLELAKILAQADLFVDYHQTNQPAAFPFFTFAYHEESYRWAALMGAAEHFVTRDMKVAFSTEGLCGDEWVRSRGKPAVTLELGKAGLSHEAYRITLASLQRIIGFVETQLEHGKRPSPPEPTADQDLRFFEVSAKMPWPGDEAALKPGLENFQEVRAGEEIGISRPGETLYATAEGFLMFPKYPKRNAAGQPVEAQGGDIVQIVRPLAKHPRLLWGE
ncbi:MAG: hypothetical protein RIR26_2003 [Pseudomonadota bacterium]